MKILYKTQFGKVITCRRTLNSLFFIVSYAFLFFQATMTITLFVLNYSCTDKLEIIHIWLSLLVILRCFITARHYTNITTCTYYTQLPSSTRETITIFFVVPTVKILPQKNTRNCKHPKKTLFLFLFKDTNLTTRIS